MVKSIFLTGHTGFLGSVIYQELKKDFNVITMGRNEGCDYVVDFSQWDGSLDLEHPIDAIVHVAGLAHNKAHSDEEMKRVNVTTVDFLLKLASLETIENIVFISSVAVYGRDYGLKITEDSDLNPKSVYGVSKRDSEILITKWAKENNSNFLSLRLPLIVGPNPPGNLGMLIRSIQNGHHIFLNGNMAKKSVVFASDVAAFIEKWLLSSVKKSGVINLSNVNTPTFNWIEKTIVKDSPKAFKISIPIALTWNFIVSLRKYLGISVPFIGKLFYPLTFSDALAREEYGYTSKELNQTTFKNELNSNN
jgi:nucleoside-diphosphate-sugar epimerase